MTNHEIGLDVSQTDQAVDPSSSTKTDHEVTKINRDPTNCEQEVKPEDKFKPTNLRGPSYPRVTSKLVPFKSPLQRSSAENVPLGNYKFFLTVYAILLLRCLMFSVFGEGQKKNHYLISPCLFSQQYLMKKKIFVTTLTWFGKLLKFILELFAKS